MNDTVKELHLKKQSLKLETQEAEVETSSTLISFLKKKIITKSYFNLMSTTPKTKPPPGSKKEEKQLSLQKFSRKEEENIFSLVFFSNYFSFFSNQGSSLT